MTTNYAPSLKDKAAAILELRRRETVKPRNSLTPVEFAAQNLVIMDKHDQLIPLIYNRTQREFLADRSSRDLVLKARQEGISTAIQGEYIHIATNETARTLTLADSDDNTQKLRRMALRFYENFPNPPPRGQNNATITTYPRTGSEATIATAGNKNSGRAGSYRFIHCSEAAFYPDLSAIIASALQAGSPEWVVLESTPNGAQGKFYELCMEALDPKANSIWKLHWFPWFQHEEYAIALNEGESLQFTNEEAMLIGKHQLTAEQINWRRLKIRELTPRLFMQEYCEDPVECFLSSGASVFSDFRHALYTPSTDDKPIEGHYHVAGLDWGQTDDYTSLSIRDCEDDREVYLNRWRQLAWSDIRAKVLDACAYWHVNVLSPEKNSASSNIENLEAESQARGLQMDIVPFSMTNERKASMVGQLYKAIHEGESKLIDIAYANAELQAFQSAQTPNGAWTYAATPPNHDDTIIARMAALRVQNRRI